MPIITPRSPTVNVVAYVSPAAAEFSPSVSRTLAYLDPNPDELISGQRLVNEAEQSTVVRACQDLMRQADDMTLVEHCGRTGLATAIMSERAGLTREQSLLGTKGALCHDVARIEPKIRAVTESPERFTGNARTEALRIIQYHAPLGAEIIRALPADDPDKPAIAEIAGGHHAVSKAPGYGPFPHFTAGIARFVAFGDELDALASPRIYKPALSEGETRQILERQFGGVTGLVELCFEHGQ